jgi:hypothetical protein
MRMNITSGKQPGGFSAGDVLLLEGADYVVLHPQSKTFSLGILLDDALRQSESPPIRSKTDSVQVVTDTTVVEDTVFSLPTRRFRVLASYRTIVLRDIPSGSDLIEEDFIVRMHLTFDYWIADSGMVAPSQVTLPALRTTGGSDLALQLAAASRELPRRPLVKQRTTTEMVTRRGSGRLVRDVLISPSQTVLISNDSFVIPADYLDVIRADSTALVRDSLRIARFRVPPS